MVEAIVSESVYAAHRRVTAARVTNWIARQRLTPPALLPDGRIDVALADEQLPVVVRRAAPAPRRRPTIRRDDAADLLADRPHGRGRPPGDRHDREEPIGAFVVVDELPGLAQHLRLDRGQTAALSRWFLGRRTA